MAINLLDIRQASFDYIKASVTCKLENLVADIPVAISPGEGFKFDLRATNNGNLRLVKVKYHVYVTDPTKVMLSVPVLPMGIRVARSGSTDDSPLLDPGSLVSEMYLFPLDADRKSLDPGETDIWPRIRGLALSLGDPNIRFNVLARVDIDYLFPDNTSSQRASMPIPIV